MTTEDQPISAEKVALVLNSQQIHKSVRNYLINECDVSKDKIDGLVRSLVDQKVEEILRHHILSSHFFERLIGQTIMKLVKEGVQTGQWYDSKKPFTAFLQNEIGKAVHDLVREKYDIAVKEKKDD